jgi:hypothetical protein
MAPSAPDVKHPIRIALLARPEQRTKLPHFINAVNVGGNSPLL